MGEFTLLIAEGRRLCAAGCRFVTGMVVAIEGPSYRRPGARMIVREDGSTMGMISGGCLEGEVARHALGVLERGRPDVLTLDISDPDDLSGFGVGCGGRVHVLLTPCGPDWEATPIAALESALEGRRPATLKTPYTLNAEARVFEERLLPIPRLVIFGDGPDVAPLVHAARFVGWEVTVVGERPTAVLAERFPESDTHRFVMHVEDLDTTEIDAWTAVILMTHNYHRDRNLLRILAGSHANFIGLLGSGKRTAALLDSLVERPLLDGRLRAPVGLDIGSETPEEIAISIVAEIQGYWRGHEGGPLHRVSGPIH